MTVIRTLIAGLYYYVVVTHEGKPFLYPWLDCAEKFETRELADMAKQHILQLPEWTQQSLELHTFQLEKVS